jgi:hypothetical protein
VGTACPSWQSLRRTVREVSGIEPEISGKDGGTDAAGIHQAAGIDGHRGLRAHLRGNPGRPMTARETLVKARSGIAFAVPGGARFRIVDVEGKQVSDLVVFLAGDLAERFSPGNTRKLNGALKIGKGGVLYSTRCRPLLTITEDTVGEHDLLFSSCSPYDYRVRFGLTTPHASCLAILAEVLAPHGISEAMIPDPLNVFQRTVITPGFRLETDEPLSRAGDYVELRAEQDCLVALTACPQDRNACNGWNPTAIRVVLS